jgi:hypothetical protein
MTALRVKACTDGAGGGAGVEPELPMVEVRKSFTQASQAFIYRTPTNLIVQNGLFNTNKQT